MADGVKADKMEKDGAVQPPARSLLRFLPAAVVIAGLAAGYAMGWHRYLSLEFLAASGGDLKSWVAANPVLAPLAFFLVYVLAVAFSFPAATVLTVFAGFLFGWLFAGVLVAFAATAGATLLFLAARSAFGSLLRKRVGGRVVGLARGFGEDAFGYLLVLRLAPVFPFFVVNIAPALFEVRLRTYVAATFIGILPATFAYTWLGQGVESVLAAAAARGREATLGDLVTPEITVAFLLLALVAAVPMVIRQLRRRAEAGRS
jgi:uncharacterized membrane protein YdjX (TVP38/TMEM64 family)